MRFPSVFSKIPFNQSISSCRFSAQFPSSFQLLSRPFGVLAFGRKTAFVSPRFSKSQEVVSPFALCEFSKSISYAGHVLRRDGPKVARMKPTEPNQALEPTTTAVTDRAGARSAPAAVVAHL